MAKKARTKYKGGKKKAFKNRKEYQSHLREMVKQGKGTQADGTWDNAGLIGNPGMHAHLSAGYKFVSG